MAYDLQDKTCEIIDTLRLEHVNKDRISCIRSRGSRSRRTIARIHTLPKAMQLGMNCGAYYVIEFLERFERLSEDEKVQVIIHELLHIPKTFGGGFRHHDYVQKKRVKELFETYKQRGKIHLQRIYLSDKARATGEP